MMENRVEKAVVVLFPDKRTTGDFYHKEGENSILVESFRHATTLTLERYKRAGYRTIGLVYKDTGNENFSYLYPQKGFSDLIIWDKSFSELVNRKDEFYKNYSASFPNFVNDLGLLPESEVIVGGYHAQDCVARLAGYLRSERYKTRVDLRLTDELPFLLISHYMRNRLPKGLRSEHVDEDSLIWERKKESLNP